MRDWRDCRAIITGASRGIGRCLAEKLAQRGVQLILAARSEPPLREMAERLSRGGSAVTAVAADVTLAEDRERLLDAAKQRWGGLDLLVNNAGVASFGHFDSSSEDILRRVMEVNFFAPAEMMRSALPMLMKGRQPAVVNVASLCGRRGLPGWPEHCASKFALVGLSEALRGEFARFDVDVLLVLPGLVKSDDLGRHLLRNEGRMPELFENAQPPEEVADAIVRAIERNCRETHVGRQARWLLRVNRWAPRLVDRLLARKVRQLYPE
ncbi:MAG: SDR family NAD(P)-dependent oxidoreductase [Gemmataceae bacterium]|nr:SDR family NAD(P)-dependent oxidoreductase [Gemmataceae bacterium]